VRKSCSCTLSAVALVLVAHANITGISKMGFANMSSKLMSTHGNQVRGHGKSERATALEGVSNVLPAPRAEILQKQANRPHVQELFLSGVHGLCLQSLAQVQHPLHSTPTILALQVLGLIFLQTPLAGA